MIIGISSGDINGIGIEVTLKAIQKRKWPDDVSFKIIGSEKVIKEQSNHLGINIPKKVTYENIGEANWYPGELRTDASHLAYNAIDSGITSCLSNKIDALVTSPISKNGFKKANINFPGHTEILGKMTKSSNFGMMLIGGGLRVMLVTRHIPLSNVAKSITYKKIKDAIDLSKEGLEWLGVINGKIGVCGLNPHAGDGGALGKEEIEIINPVINSYKNKNLNISGTHSADTIFFDAKNGKYECVIAMYHDQGLGPLKTIGFDEGVNLTLGLPIIRTSPDHGTAFNLAGKNQASPLSMINAIKIAIELARKKNPWKTQKK
ncbi:MAG: 4-hydroxythreonine-4-phosphate dehydrogenase PdxA [Verrucomicrobiota bacterium]|nr:4-hydroxythreonine-4-phosphate dehydrogenase PdxA [Verrucomicrobiota bacterium]MEC8753073.1 4-hydroxythreonine-4-phosphate dehydrogenase PdxA [Verrucomicrobiota bacterium]|tara:strand:- start:640 stop:1596 length:957 start_codon:yes stop_codon:yes gene_type:complete